MQLIRDIDNIKFPHNGYVASIGNYDGMHLGHQRIISKVKAQSLAMKLPSLVIIFEPQTTEYFLKQHANPRLMSLREKLVILQSYGIDWVLCLRFNDRLANMTAEQFIQDILLQRLSIQHIIFGDDFAFGNNRTGGFELLQQYIATEKVPTIQINNTKVSSTHIRQALAANDFKSAATLLGRSYTISGRVAHGDKLGHKLGFPTANIYLQHKILPIRGVYITKVYNLANKALIGVTNVGNRPTINGSRNVLEVHLLNFAKDIYGKRITIEFIKKLRDEIKFASLDELKQQIEKDVKQASTFTVKDS